MGGFWQERATSSGSSIDVDYSDYTLYGYFTQSLRRINTMISYSKWVSLAGLALCVLVAQLHAEDILDLFPVQEIRDPSSLELKIHKRQQIPSQQQPSRILTRIEVEFTSFVWEGEVWRHRAYVYLPDRRPEKYKGAGVVVSSARPDDPVYIRYAEAAALMGIPALMIRDSNPGTRYGQKGEGEVIGYGDKRFRETGDLRWSGYSWLARVMMRAITAAQQIPEFSADRFVVTGCSKRGAASWISSAADDRVVGAFPTCWNFGNFDDFLQLKAERWGMDYRPRLVDPNMVSSIKNTETTNAPAFITTGEQIKHSNHPYAKKLASIQDPYEFADLLEGKKILYSDGINDPLFPAPSDTVLLKHMPKDVRVQLVANARHTAATEEQATAWPMWLAHTFAGRELASLDSSHEVQGGELIVNANVRASHSINAVRLWYAADQNGAYLDANWQPVEMSHLEDGRYQAKLSVNTPYLGYFIEVHDRDAELLSGLITSGFQEYHR
jgi:PhoPQ-activated pathogenicity-related protein